MKITPVIEKYIHHWGEMGLRWGTNRTVAQIQALLYLSPKPLNTEEISDLLSIAQSHVSTSLRELQNYGVVKMTHLVGDRNDYFEKENEAHQVTRERIHNMLSFVNSINNWYEKIKSISNATLQKIMQLGNAITKLVGK